MLVVAVRHEDAAARQHLARNAAQRPHVGGERPARAEEHLGRAVVPRLDQRGALLVEAVVRRVGVVVRGDVVQLRWRRRNGVAVAVVIVGVMMKKKSRRKGIDS